LAEIPGLHLDPAKIETNMVFFDIAEDQSFDAAALCERLKPMGVLALGSGPRTVRMVCHLDVSRAMIDRAIGLIASACRTPIRA
jgi:threonine aldolase